MHDRYIIQRIKDSIDLAAFIANAVKLKKQGSSWIGLCPFHVEKTPSFHVISERNFYHCFGCGKHGDIFSWLMERDNISFQEAIEQLARNLGIEYNSNKVTINELNTEERLRFVINLASTFYQNNLEQSVKCLNYLQSRSIKSDFVKEIGLGYAPDTWNGLLNYLKECKVSPELAEQAGLVSRSERGNYIDFLRDRLVIPICDIRGRTIGFGGRLLSTNSNAPKYLNTRETTLFNKGAIVFGLNRAKGFLRNGALLVEGYFDVLQLQQMGINQTVGILGTAVTDKHLQQLGRLTKNLTLCFDGDVAGMNAIEKSLKLALPLGFNIKLLLLPEGEDPDSWCIKLGSSSFSDLINKAPDWTKFIIDRVLDGKDRRQVSERIEALKKLSDFLIFLPKDYEQRELFASLAYDLHIPLTELYRTINAKMLAVNKPTCVVVNNKNNKFAINELLKPILILCNRNYNFLKKIMTIPNLWWESLAGANILQAMIDADGKYDLLPSDVTAQLRYLEAKCFIRDQIELLQDQLLLKLELNFVEREKQVINHQLEDPAVLVDNSLQNQLYTIQDDLMKRSRQIRLQLATIRRSLFAQS